jgi:hypothetical protein
MFSTCIRYPVEKMSQAPVVFIQYLAAMATVNGIKNYDKGYETLPIKLKWPNDICEAPLHLVPAPNGSQFHRILLENVNCHAWKKVLTSFCSPKKMPSTQADPIKRLTSKSAASS